MVSISSSSRATLVVSMLLFGCSSPPGENAAPAPESASTPASPASPPPLATAPSTAPSSARSTGPRYHEHRLFAADPAPFDHLGFSIAASAGVVASGARLADAPGLDTGAVYLFRRDPAGWRQERKLVAADAVPHDHFGHSVALDGDTLVVGAIAHHEHGRRESAVYVYRFGRGAWRFEGRLTVPGAKRFAHAVAVDGDLLAVGAPGMIVGDTPAGGVVLFRRRGSSWQQEAVLTAGDAAPYDLFGLCVGVSGDRVVAGAPSDDDLGSMTGALYVFERSPAGWREAAKLVPADGMALAELGKTCGIDGDTVVGGADGVAREVGKSAGAAFVFRRGAEGWAQEGTLLASDAKKADRFGNSVAIAGETIAVGAHYVDDEAGLGAGAVYVFERLAGTWEERTKLLSGSSFVGEELGWSVAIDKRASGGRTITSGALNGGPGSTLAGVISVFEPATP